MVKKTLEAWCRQLPAADFRKIGCNRIVNISRMFELQHEDTQDILAFRDVPFTLPLKRAETKRIRQFIRKLK